MAPPTPSKFTTKIVQGRITRVPSFESDLPPMDAGSRAWLFVLGASVVEAIMWGFAVTFGIFQAYYSHLPLFSSSHSSLPIIGTSATALSYFGQPIVSPLLRRNPHYQTPCLWCGWSLCVFSLLLASFAQTVTHLILTQGVLFGIGWALTYTPFLIMANGWFVARRGFVYGIIFSSSGLMGLILPFLLQELLDNFGFRDALRIFAGIAAAVTAPAMLLLRPRIVRKPSQTTPSGQKYTHIFRNKSFLIFSAAVFFQSVGFFLPRFFLPQFAREIALSHSQAASSLSMVALAQVFGQLFAGYVSDKININLPVFVSTAATGIAVFALWGPAHGMRMLIGFAVIYGSCGGAYAVLWSRMIMYLTEDEGTTIAMYGIFSVARGCASVLSGPISSALILDHSDLNSYAIEKYRYIVYFVGATMIVSSLSGLSYFWQGSVEKAKMDEKLAVKDGHSAARRDGMTKELQPFVRSSGKSKNKTSSH